MCYQVSTWASYGSTKISSTYACSTRSRSSAGLSGVAVRPNRAARHDILNIFIEYSTTGPSSGRVPHPRIGGRIRGVAPRGCRR